MAHELVVSDLPSFPVIDGKLNPFHYDHYHMGTYLTGDEWMIMHGDGDNRFGGLKYLILINVKTGQRFKIDLNPVE